MGSSRLSRGPSLNTGITRPTFNMEGNQALAEGWLIIWEIGPESA